VYRKRIILTVTAVLALLTLGTVLVYIQTNKLPVSQPTPTPSPSPTPEPKLASIEATVTPWGTRYRKEPDFTGDFIVELVYPKQSENFATDRLNVTFNAGSRVWIIQRAYFTSDLFSGERWINITLPTASYLGLQKTFTFNLTNVPDGNHNLTLTVVFHDGTRSNSTALFNVLTQRRFPGNI
jgi:hypothetical protein